MLKNLYIYNLYIYIMKIKTEVKTEDLDVKELKKKLMNLQEVPRHFL